MKTKHTMLSMLLLTVTLGNPVLIHAVDKNDYADSVMDIMRMHVNLLQELAVSRPFQYSDNMVRHAVEIKNTFGLLGPMEWHAAEAAAIFARSNGTPVDISEDRFESMAKLSRDSIKQLARAAHTSMEQNNPQVVLSALNDMQQSCENCHAHLPRALAPDLWRPIQRVRSVR